MTLSECVSRLIGMGLSWIEWVVKELDGSPVMQVLFFVLVILGRFALDRWERQRERRKHTHRRSARDG